MARPPSLFVNMCLRQNPMSFHGTVTLNQIRNLSIDQINKNSKETMQNSQSPDESFAQNQIPSVSETVELMQNPQNPDEILAQNLIFGASEVAREVSNIIRTRSRWEQTIMRDFPTVNFADPIIYSEVLKQQTNVFLLLRFYHWLRSLNGFSLDPILCNVMFSRLVEARAAKAAKSFLDETKFEPEPRYLESYVVCLCEIGLVDQALDWFERLKMIGHCASLDTWNSALSHSVRTKRIDVFWRLYGDMLELGVANVDIIGHLAQAFCIENNVAKGFELLRQVLEAGHVPSKIALNKLLAMFCKSGDYGKVSAVLHGMIVKNCSPDIYTYQEVINGLCKRGMIYEGFRIFNELKERGYFPDRVLYTTMIHGLSKNKCLGDARKLWFEMIQKGIIPNEYTYNVFIYGLWRTGSIDEAGKLYKEMLAKGYGETTISYNTMINGMCLNGKVEEARVLFEQMNEKGIVSDAITYSSLIKGFSHKGKIAEGLYFFNELLKLGLQPTISSFSVLIEKLCEAGHVKEAKILWQEVHDRGMKAAVFSQNKIIVGLSELGHFAEGIALLESMIKSEVTPKKKTFERLIQCLSMADRLDDALFVLGCMLKMGFVLEKCVLYSLLNKLCLGNSNHMEASLEGVLGRSSSS